jgi:hypothetical protein
MVYAEFNDELYYLLYPKKQFGLRTYEQMENSKDILKEIILFPVEDNLPFDEDEYWAEEFTIHRIYGKM